MIGIGISRYNLPGLLNQEKALVGIAGLKNLFEDPPMNLVMPVIVQTMSSDTVPRIITDHIQTEVNEAKTAPTKAREEQICRVTSTDIAFCFAEFLTTLEGNSAHAGSTDLDCILSVKLTLFFTIQQYTSCLSTLLNPIFFELKKCYVLLATDTHTQIRKSGVVR